MLFGVFQVYKIGMQNTTVSLKVNQIFPFCVKILLHFNLQYDCTDNILMSTEILYGGKYPRGLIYSPPAFRSY